ncbi:MAG: hypothetical protein U1F43_36355 [Myxococcota bacterium]
MSPEQADGLTEQLDPRSDQFALGMLLQELVTLREARSARSLDEALRAAMGGRRNPVVHRDPKVVVKRELHAIIAKATAYRKDDRCSTVAAFADDVRRFLRDEPVLAEPGLALGSASSAGSAATARRRCSSAGSPSPSWPSRWCRSWAGARPSTRARATSPKAREDRLQGTAALVGAGDAA